jgi:hypothetical protein
MLDILLRLAAHAAVTAFIVCILCYFAGFLKAICEADDDGTFSDMLTFAAVLFATVFLVIATIIAAMATIMLAWDYCLLIT